MSNNNKKEAPKIDTYNLYDTIDDMMSQKVSRRMFAEYAQLKYRIKHILDAIVKTGEEDNFDLQNILIEQYECMAKYRDVLSRRMLGIEPMETLNEYAKEYGYTSYLEFERKSESEI
jgi:hypothetical protein